MSFIMKTSLLTGIVLLASCAAEASCVDSLAAFRKYGLFRFQLGGAMQTLTAYQRMDLPEQERNWVLIPFQDRTNGKETYGGGRYLELYFPIGAHTELDFNRAYNPLCAYDSKFTCPMPPPENRLKIAVTAGEKAYAGKH